MNIPHQPEQLQLFDNYGLWHIPFWQQSWFMFVTSLVLCFILVGLLYAFWQRKRSRKVILSPAEQALHDLQLLKKKGLCTIEKSGAFYVGLTAILKNYVSSLFFQDVRSNTDRQMLNAIQSMPLFDAQKEGLTRIFSAGELIKFARQDALHEQIQVDWQFSYDFIKNAGKELEVIKK